MNRQQNALERAATDRDSRVCEDVKSLRDSPSSTVHVKPRVNQSGPPDKAKYYLVTDSELVP